MEGIHQPRCGYDGKEAGTLSHPESNQPVNQAQLSGGSSGSGMLSLVGRVIDEFEVRREIGRGGMGTVYEAWQKSLNRVVALKVLPMGIGQSEVGIQRFQREAQAAAKLSHENIVPIFSIGESDGIYYYTMEYVDGASLYDTISVMRGGGGASSAMGLTETQPLGASAEVSDSEAKRIAEKTDSSVQQSLSRTTAEHFYEIARQTAAAADALQYAHNRGVIHRDIKPHNFLQGTDGRLRITDFGLARIMEQPGVTMTGEFVGSPLYMSPEQITGGRVPVDHRTDIYSLGATMYEWLTLQPPYPGQTREQVISRIISSDVRPPKELNEAIPLDLETICLKALEKDADRRYRSAGEMAEDLRRFLKSEAILAKRDGILTRVAKKVTRNRAVSVAALIAIVAVASTYVFSSKSAEKKLQGKEQDLTAERIEREKLEARLESLEQENQTLVEALPADVQLAVRTLGAGSEALRGALSGLQAPDMSAAGMGLGQSPAPEFAAYSEQDAATLALIGDELQELVRRSLVAPAPSNPALLAARTVALSLCQQALEAEDLDEALRLVDEANRQDGSLYDGLFLRSIIHARRAEFTEARDWADVMIAANGARFPGHLMRGIASLFLGEASTAQQDLSRSLGLGGSRYPAVYVVRAMARGRLGQIGEAFEDLDYVLGLRPEHQGARQERDRLVGSLESRVASLTDAITADDKDFDALVQRAELYYQLGEYEKAIEDYDAAAKLRKADPALFLARIKAVNALQRTQRSGRFGRQGRGPGVREGSGRPMLRKEVRGTTNMQRRPMQ